MARVAHIVTVLWGGDKENQSNRDNEVKFCG